MVLMAGDAVDHCADTCAGEGRPFNIFKEPMLIIAGYTDYT